MHAQTTQLDCQNIVPYDQQTHKSQAYDVIETVCVLCACLHVGT